MKILEAHYIRDNRMIWREFAYVTSIKDAIRELQDMGKALNVPPEDIQATVWSNPRHLSRIEIKRGKG